MEALNKGMAWTPISIKPQKSCRCLITVNVREYDYDGNLNEYRVVRSGSYEKLHDEFLYGDNLYPIDKSRNKKAVAWMPLPEPYNVEVAV